MRKYIFRSTCKSTSKFSWLSSLSHKRGWVNWLISLTSVTDKIKGTTVHEDYFNKRTVGRTYASRVRNSHDTLRTWWSERPLVSCRSLLFGEALMLQWSGIFYKINRNIINKPSSHSHKSCTNHTLVISALASDSQLD